MNWLKYAAKAVFAGIVTLMSGLIAALAALETDNPSPRDLGWIEGLTIGLATIIAVFGVFGITNGPNPNEVSERAEAIKRERSLEEAARAAV